MSRTEDEEEAGRGRARWGFSLRAPGPSAGEIERRFDELIRRRWRAAAEGTIEVEIEGEEIRLRLPPHLATARSAEVSIEHGVVRLRVRRETSR
ncbi:MAG TPA: hypothetical protein VMW35_17560 [Myxococcota bacterium]|jgi:hypothetical protein|nr:hypothetical protein [Myxococcota bacterium]